MTQILVAGVDPSLNNFGLSKATVDIETKSVVLHALELVTTESDTANKKVVRKNSDDLERARKLHKGLLTFIKDVDLVVVEIPVGSQSARAMASYGICIGVLAAIDKPFIQVTPTEVKLVSVGSKTASKAQMIEWATKLYPNADWLTQKRNGTLQYISKNEHLADSVAAIHAGLFTDQMKYLSLMFKNTG